LWNDGPGDLGVEPLLTGSGTPDNKWGAIVEKYRDSTQNTVNLQTDKIMSWIKSDSVEGRTYEADKTMLAALIGMQGTEQLATATKDFVKISDDNLRTSYYAGYLIHLARVAYKYNYPVYQDWEPMLERYFRAFTHEEPADYTEFYPLVVVYETTSTFKANSGGQPIVATVPGLINYEMGGAALQMAWHADESEKRDFKKLYTDIHNANASSCKSCHGGGLKGISGIYCKYQLHWGKAVPDFNEAHKQAAVSDWNSSLHTDSNLVGTSAIGVFDMQPEPFVEVYLSGRSGLTANPKAKLVAANPFTENAEIEIDMKQDGRDAGYWDAFFLYLKEQKKYTGPIQVRVFLKGDKTDDPNAVSTFLTNSDIQAAGNNLVSRVVESNSDSTWSDVSQANMKKLLSGEATLKYIHVIEDGEAPEIWTYVHAVQIKVPGVQFINMNTEVDPDWTPVAGYSKGPNDDMMFRAKPRDDFASFIIDNDDIHYYSAVATPYAEIKAGYVQPNSGSVEDFNAMTGTPTTETLFFASGGSEFVVQMDGEFVQNDTYTRTYTVTYSPVACAESNHPAGGDPDPMNAPCYDTGDSTSWTQKFTGLNYVKFRNLKLWQLTDSRVTNMKKLAPAGSDVIKGSIESAGPDYIYNVADFNGTNGIASGRIYLTKTNDKGDNWAFVNQTTTDNSHSSHTASNAADLASKLSSAPTFEAYCISDYLILRTSNGNQCVMYYEYKSDSASNKIGTSSGMSVTAQDVKFSKNPTLETVWKSNSEFGSSKTANYAEGDMTFGGYNGKWAGDYAAKYKSFGGAYNMTNDAFDKLVVNKYSDYTKKKSTTKPDETFRLINYFDMSNTVDSDPYNTPNGIYYPQDSSVFYKNQINYGPAKPHYSIQQQSLYGNQPGFVLSTSYSSSHEKINDVVVHDPVSVQYARVISLPEERDQRTDEYKNIEPAKQHVVEGCPGIAENCAYSYIVCTRTGEYHTAECFNTVTRTHVGPNNDHRVVQYWGWDSKLIDSVNNTWASPAFVAPYHGGSSSNPGVLVWEGTSAASWSDPIGFAFPSQDSWGWSYNGIALTPWGTVTVSGPSFYSSCSNSSHKAYLTLNPDTGIVTWTGDHGSGSGTATRANPNPNLYTGLWIDKNSGAISHHATGVAANYFGSATLMETEDYWEWDFWPEDTNKTGAGFRVPYYMQSMYSPYVMLWHGTSYDAGHDEFYFAFGTGATSTQYAVWMDTQNGRVFYTTYSGGAGAAVPSGTQTNLGTAERVNNGGGTWTWNGKSLVVGQQLYGSVYAVTNEVYNSYRALVIDTSNGQVYAVCSSSPHWTCSDPYSVGIASPQPAGPVLVRYYKIAGKPSYSTYDYIEYYHDAVPGNVVFIDENGYTDKAVTSGYVDERSIQYNTKQTTIDAWLATKAELEQNVASATTAYDPTSYGSYYHPVAILNRHLENPPKVRAYKITGNTAEYNPNVYIDELPWRSVSNAIWYDERDIAGNTKQEDVDRYWNVHTDEGEIKYPETRSYNEAFMQLACDDPHHALTTFWKPFAKGLAIGDKMSSNLYDGVGDLPDDTLLYFRGTNKYHSVATIKAQGYIVLHSGQYHLTVSLDRCDYCGASLSSGTQKWRVSDDSSVVIVAGGHYPKGDSRCWAPCLNDDNHKVNLFPDVNYGGLDTTQYTPGKFLNLDYAFNVYYPNIGDFYGNGEQFSYTASTIEGWGYTNAMDVTKWTKSKWIQFPFDVVLLSADGQEKNLSYPAGTAISLDVPKTNFVFYCTLTNSEWRDACIKFWSIALNNQYDSRDIPDTILNYDRPGYKARHSAYKEQYLDVVGRIGALTAEDTGDMRFSNFFKTPLIPTQWRVNQIIKMVDETKQNFLMVDPKDIRGHFYNDTTTTDVPGYTENRTGALDTYGARQERRDAGKLIPMPIVPSKNNISALVRQPVRIGYDAFLDLITLGDYYGDNDPNSVAGDDAHQVQIIPYYYHINLDTGEWVMVDVYYSKDGVYRLINEFGSNATPPYSPAVALNWRDEYLRRNYSETSTTGEVSRTNVVNESSMSVVPFGSYYEFGTYASYHLKARNRTYIGYEVQNGIYRDPTNQLSGYSPLTHGQRWHFTQGLPSSAVVVEAGRPATQANIDALANLNGVIAVALNIVSHGMVYDLQYDGTWINQPFKVTPEGITIDPANPPVRPPIPSSGIPEPKTPGKDPVVVVYTDDRSSKDDLRVEGTQ
jgi:hypothetical protein